MKIIVKSKYQVNELVSEDIISFCYQGTLKYLNQSIIVWEYKSEYLNSTLVTRLINIAEKLIHFHQKAHLK